MGPDQLAHEWANNPKACFTSKSGVHHCAEGKLYYHNRIIARRIQKKGQEPVFLLATHSVRRSFQPCPIRRAFHAIPHRWREARRVIYVDDPNSDRLLDHMIYFQSKVDKAADQLRRARTRVYCMHTIETTMQSSVRLYEIWHRKEKPIHVEFPMDWTELCAKVERVNRQQAERDAAREKEREKNAIIFHTICADIDAWRAANCPAEMSDQELINAWRTQKVASNRVADVPSNVVNDLLRKHGIPTEGKLKRQACFGRVRDRMEHHPVYYQVLSYSREHMRDLPEGTDYLRLSEDGLTVETSRSAKVPLEHVRKVWPLVLRLLTTGQTYKHNGHTIHLGHYQLDEITADGTITAGCHRFTKAEVLAFAQHAGLPTQP